MGRLQTIGPRLTSPASRLQGVAGTEARRITGRPLQARRLRLWSKDPHCAACRSVVAYPHGFHLDHIVALMNGGDDTESNLQVLCHGCHEAKTRDDLRGG
ncbi:MAG TPA: HNH endonuclease signature motif containing protein [Thermomonas sp.]